MLLVITLFTLLIGLLFPSLGQTVRQSRHCELYEEMLRQGFGIDTTVFQALRYGRNFTITADRITFDNVQGKRSGFRVWGKQFYLLLSNGQRQPLSGGSSKFADHTIYVLPYENRPYFTRNGRNLEVALLLQDKYGRISWPFLLSVVPVNEEVEE